MSWLDWVAMVLLVVGGLNWGLVGLFGSDWDVVAKVFTAGSTMTRLVYDLVGLSALYLLFAMPMMNKRQ